MKERGGTFFSFPVTLRRYRPVFKIWCYLLYTNLHLRSTESIPDIKPTFGVVATYLFLSTAGLAIGGNIGAFTGHYSARRLLMRDPESMGRLKKTFRNLEKIGGVPEAMGRIKMALRKVEQDVAKKKQDVEKMERDLEKMGRNREATGRIEKAFRNAKEREELAGWWEERVE